MRRSDRSTTHKRGYTIESALAASILTSSFLALAGCAGDSNRSAHAQGVATATRPLFNGVNLAGWDGDPRYWRVEDGLLTGETTADAPLAHNTFLICRTAIVGDFTLEFDYAVQSAWANSGVQYRSVEWPATTDADRWIVGGYQADIDEPVTYTGILYGERDRGILALRGQRVEVEAGGTAQVVGSIGASDDLAKAIHGRGQWNHYRIEACGTHISHSINGTNVIEVTDRDGIALSHDARGARSSGIIALQLHTGQPMKIQFREIRLETAQSTRPAASTDRP